MGASCIYSFLKNVFYTDQCHLHSFFPDGGLLLVTVLRVRHQESIVVFLCVTLCLHVLKKIISRLDRWSMSCLSPSTSRRQSGTYDPGKGRGDPGSGLGSVFSLFDNSFYFCFFFFGPTY